MSSLFLFPSDPASTPPSISSVVTTLKDNGLIGNKLTDQDYLAGEHFLQHITFAGCSPFIRFTPPEEHSTDFCHLSLRGPYEQPKLYVAGNRSRPRCPHCKHRPEKWKHRLTEWRISPSGEWSCAHCGQLISAMTLDWRQYGACGRLLVEIRQIYPGEAIPGDSLMRDLREGTNRVWQFGWAESD